MGAADDRLETARTTKMYVQFHYYARSTKSPVTYVENEKLAALHAKGIEEIDPRTMNVSTMISAQSMLVVEQAGSAPGVTFNKAQIGEDTALITKKNLKDHRKTLLAELAAMTSSDKPLNVVFLCTN